MSRVHLLTGRLQIKNTFHTIRNRTLQKASLCSSSSSSSSDEDSKLQRKLDEKKKSNEALDKLNKLLLTMTGENVSTKAKLNLAQPTNRRQKIKENQDSKEQKTESPESKLVNAAKDIAESIGGDVKQTQSELLTKLLNAASGDASSSTDLKDLVKGMKIDQENAQETGYSKAQQVRQILQEQSQTPKRKFDVGKSRPRSVKPPQDLVVEKINLFGSDPLGIFSPDENGLTEGVVNETWNHLHDKDLKLAVTHPPSNYFQQMILWTEQGKVWKFPIDNEQGLEEEKKIYFTDHVFLEKHLDPWCPSKGPLRHFMELVCVGLSKNPYLTVEAKKEHILWFRDYFKGKVELLQETGAIQDTDLGNAHAGQKQIDQ